MLCCVVMFRLWRSSAVLCDVKQSLLFLLQYTIEKQVHKWVAGVLVVYIFLCKLSVSVRWEAGVRLMEGIGGECMLWDVKKSLLFFIIVYNRGAGSQVSGGCTGLLLFFIVFESWVCRWETSVRWKSSVCCAVGGVRYLLFIILVYNRGL